MTKNQSFGMSLSFAAFIMQVAMLFVGSGTDLLFKYLGVATAILASLCSFVYFFKGGTKEFAKWRNLFCIMLTISLFFSLLKSAQSDKGMINNLCILFTAIITGYLAFAKNLGKTKSIILAIIVVLLQIITIIPIIISGNNISIVKSLGIISSTLLVLLLLSTTYIKYSDKKQRGVE